MGRSGQVGEVAELGEATLRRARRGVDEELAGIFDLHYARLVRAARFIVDDRETAEDVVMEAFVGLHRRWRHLRDGGDPGAGGGSPVFPAFARASS